ncbi:hypothetical protein RitSun_15 [Mycobacterium phage RitSun]|nr:hypothetical protein RitSun_15 [Mycobacterium phage RitSun]
MFPYRRRVASSLPATSPESSPGNRTAVSTTTIVDAATDSRNCLRSGEAR